MTSDPALEVVGLQLQARREDLDQTQEELAQRIGITPTTVSAIERGRNAISRSKRPAWEAALGLKAGTITRAYRGESRVEAREEGRPDDGGSPTAWFEQQWERYKDDPGEKGLVLRGLLWSWADPGDRPDRSKVLEPDEKSDTA